MGGYKYKVPSRYEFNRPSNKIGDCLSCYFHLQWPLLKLALCVSGICYYKIFILMTPIPVLGRTSRIFLGRVSLRHSQRARLGGAHAEERPCECMYLLPSISFLSWHRLQVDWRDGSEGPDWVWFASDILSEQAQENASNEVFSYWAQ